MRRVSNNSFQRLKLNYFFNGEITWLINSDVITIPFTSKLKWKIVSLFNGFYLIYELIELNRWTGRYVTDTTGNTHYLPSLRILACQFVLY